MRYLTAPS